MSVEDPEPGASAPPGPVWNTFVEADNLDVLRATRRGSVDLVYADPPYNTGNAFTYRDSGGDHAAWVAMMRPRLDEARAVLAETGAIFVSIDDHEVAHLRLLLDEVFGEANLLAQVVVNLNPKGRQLGGGFATSHEYLLVYARDARRTACWARQPPRPSTPATSRSGPGDGRRFRHLPLRNTNKRFNPVTARTLHYPLWGDPELRPGGRGAVRRRRGGAAGLRRRHARGVALEPAAGRGARRATWCAAGCGAGWGAASTSSSATGCTRAAARSCAPIWLAEEVGLDRHRGGRAEGAARARLRVARSRRACCGACWTRCRADARVLDSFAGSGRPGTPWRWPTPPTAAPGRCVSVNSAEPTRPGSNAQRRGLRHRRRDHPRPAARRGRAGRRWFRRGAAAGGGRRAGPVATR